MTSDPDDLRRHYDAVAAAYAENLGTELDGKPLDREALRRFAGLVRDGIACDVGCGPGHIADWLHQHHGTRIRGVDLSPEMIAEARRRNPALQFEVADFTAMPSPLGGFAGIVAFYAIVHANAAALPAILRSWHRALRPGGWLLLAFHVGREVVHRDELWGHAVDLDFVFFETDTVLQALLAAGFAIDTVTERDPYPNIEYPSRRAYLFATAHAHDLRRAGPEDAALLTEIAHAAKRSWGYPEEWIQAWAPVLVVTEEFVRSNAAWIAVAGDTALGWGALVDCGTHWSVEHLWVRPEHHRHGVGRRLFDAMMRHVAERRPGRVRIESDPYAVPFYESRGARQVGWIDAPVLGTERRLPVLEFEVPANPRSAP